MNLGDAAQARTAYAEILASAKAYAPQARIIGASAPELAGEGVEVIIGVSCDPRLGPEPPFGSGGVVVEVYNDVASRRCPITRAEVQAMIAEFKGALLLQGFRGRPVATSRRSRIRWCACRASPCIWKGIWRSSTSIRSWCGRQVGAQRRSTPSSYCAAHSTARGGG